jgi:DNA-binding transcriptional LysR family regulator
VTIADLGSFTKAARKLRLSQPAVTAQIRRLQTLVGGDLFVKTSGGLKINDQGRLVLDLARKMLDANDQILSLTGGSGEAQPMRVGISNVFVEKFLVTYAQLGDLRYLHIHADNSDEIANAFHEAQVDVSCSFEPLSSDRPIEEWRLPFVWVRAPTFMIRPDEPIPIIARAGGFLARVITDSLDQVGLRHRIVFASPDYGARKAAVAAGLGLMAVPSGFTEPNLIVASARVLPKLPPVRAGICVRKGLASTEIGAVVDALRSLAPLQNG